MGDAWYEKNATDDEKIYDQAVMKIVSAVKQGVSFNEPAKLLEIDDEERKAAIADDALKVLIAEMHFTGGNSIEKLAGSFGLPLKALLAARAEMLGQVKDAALEAYMAETEKGGKA